LRFFALGIDTIARKPGHDKATCPFKANAGLEPRLRDRHCVTCRILRDLDIVKREEFEAVKDMARLAREENEALKARISVLEAKLGISPSAPDVGSLKTDG
jgi:BMFP domain-containing protein YqiC